MPLTEEQKRIIETSIDHLLVFPAEEQPFRQRESHLVTALTGPIPQQPFPL